MKTKVLHIITKLAVGGAQENTIYCVRELNKTKDFESEILCGPTDKFSGNLEDKAKNYGIKLTKIKGITNNIRPISNFIALFKTYRYIKKNRFDIVHTHSSVAGIIGRIAAKLAGTKIIVHTVHGWGLRADMGFFKRNLYVLLERFCAGFTDKLIVVSRTDIKKGLSHEIGSLRMYEVIRSGIDVKKFSEKADANKLKKELNINKKDRVVGMVARLSAQKNPLDFVRIARIVKDNAPGTKFIIVGDGELREKTELFIKKLNLENDFIITGYRKDVEKLVHLFDVSVLTSLWEGLPRVLPESMAAKKPIVAYGSDGVKEVIKEGINGFAVRPGDAKGCAEKIILLLKDAELRAKMGKNGFLMVKEFSQEKMFKDLVKTYYSSLYQKRN